MGNHPNFNRVKYTWPTADAAGALTSDGAGNLSLVAGGADVTWEQKYTTRGVSKAALTAGQVSKFFDDFGSSTGLGWTSAPVTVSAVAGVVTMPASSAIARSFNPIIARSVGPWYMAGHLRLTSGLGGGGFWVVGLHDGGSNAVAVVADPAADATHWVFKIEKSGGSTSGTSTVVIGTDWHDFEAWYTGTGSVHFSVDNETTVDLANTNLTAVNMPAGMVSSDADKTKCQLDKILYLTTLP